jgi:hypothetical protein
MTWRFNIVCCLAVDWTLVPAVWRISIARMYSWAAMSILGVSSESETSRSRFPLPAQDRIKTLLVVRISPQKIPRRLVIHIGVTTASRMHRDVMDRTGAHSASYSLRFQTLSQLDCLHRFFPTDFLQRMLIDTLTHEFSLRYLCDAHQLFIGRNSIPCPPVLDSFEIQQT